MGAVKRLLEDAEHLSALALQVNVEAQSLEECEYHEGVYYEGSADVEDAYRLANWQITSKKMQLPYGVTRRDFTDEIKSVYEDNSGISSCYCCDKNMRD